MSMSRRTRPGPKMSDAQCLELRRADEHEGFLLSSLEASGGSRVCALEAGSAHVGIPHTGSPEEGGTDVPISALARAPCALPSSPVGDSCADRPTVSIGCGLATAWWRSGLQSPTSLGSLPRALLPNTVQASFCFWNHLQMVQGARWWPRSPSTGGSADAVSPQRPQAVTAHPSVPPWCWHCCLWANSPVCLPEKNRCGTELQTSRAYESQWDFSLHILL